MAVERTQAPVGNQVVLQMNRRRALIFIGLWIAFEALVVIAALLLGYEIFL